MLFSQNKEITLIALNSIQHVRPYDHVTGKEIVEIKAAKNEYEAFQVAVIASGNVNLEDIKATISPLKNGESVIDPQNITIFREEYVFIRNSTPRPQCAAGLFPDPLLP